MKIRDRRAPCRAGRDEIGSNRRRTCVGQSRAAPRLAVSRTIDGREKGTLLF